ncbi:MAG: amino acid permease [Acidobacteriota bacterium]
MPQPALRRELNLLDALMINVGVILGSAIFLVPALIADKSGTPWMAALVWVVAGFMSWCGAVTFAELATLFPKAGGQYVYLERAYHPFLGFLYGWTVFAVIQTASIAAVSVAFMTYLAYFFPFSDAGIKLGAVLLILGLTAWNCLSLRLGATTQNFTTLLKLALLALIALACFYFGGEGSPAFGAFLPQSSAGLTGFTLALVAALWAFDGWISITYMASEVRQPQRNLPRSIFHSVLLLGGLYVLVQLAFAYALPSERLFVSERVASEAVEYLLGPLGGGLVALAVVISCFAANNGMVLSGARVYYAMAADGRFFRPLARLSSRSIPANALIAQGIWAALLSLSGSYDQLLTYVVVCSWIFYLLSATALIVLRRKRPELPRPYRVPGYPYLPGLFILMAAALLINTLWSDPRNSLIGIGITLAGAPLYFYWRQEQGKGR